MPETKAIDFLTQELRDTTDLSKYYAKVITDLQKFSQDQPVETARLISAASRGIRRMEKESKRLNKQMEKVIEDDLKSSATCGWHLCPQEKAKALFYFTTISLR